MDVDSVEFGLDWKPLSFLTADFCSLTYYLFQRKKFVWLGEFSRWKFVSGALYLEFYQCLILKNS